MGSRRLVCAAAVFAFVMAATSPAWAQAAEGSAHSRNRPARAACSVRRGRSRSRRCVDDRQHAGCAARTPGRIRHASLSHRRGVCEAGGAGREDTGDRGQSRRRVSKRCRHAHHSTDFSGRRSARRQDSAERGRQTAGGQPQPRQLWRGAVQQPRRLHALRPLHHPWCRRLVRSRHLREWQRDCPGAGCRRLELRNGARHANHPARRASSRFLHDAAVPR